MHVPEMTPEPIFETLTAYWKSSALRAAVDLDLFSTLAGGPLALPIIAKGIGAGDRATRMLCDALVALGFLVKDGGTYRLDALADLFLDPAKPTYVGAMARVVASPMLWSEHERLAAAVKHGGSLLAQSGLVPDHPFWLTFAESTFALGLHHGVMVAGELSARGTLPEGASVLDVGAGSGAYGLSLASRDPAVRVTAVDWPNVLELARANAHALEVSNQVRYVAGDMFEVDLGRDHDVAVLANVLHHFEPEGCVRLLRKIRSALKPGGVAVVVDFLPDEERKDEVLPLLFALTMLVFTPAGDTYTESQLRAFLRDAGFESVVRCAVAGTPQGILLAR